MPVIENRNELIERQNALLRMNLTWMGQALEMVASIDDQTFTASALGPHKVGSHLRHIIEFYE